MKSKIKFIGVVDKNGKPHFVGFADGVNVITGRSSTGKSAMIEIFDYCFGSSDFTVPKGVITTNGAIYFVVMEIGETTIILARKADDNHVFLKEDSTHPAIATGKFPLSYFQQDYFMPLADFKKALGFRFGLNYTDVDESLVARENRKNKSKSGTPSIRSFTSFMLQHQNLIANKHAIFYRFDESEKRDQVINHFKMFSGFVDQAYFITSQELETLQGEKLKIERAIPKDAERKEKFRDEVEFAMAAYQAASGVQIQIGAVEEVVVNPKGALDRLSNLRIEVVPLSDDQAIPRAALEREKAKKVAELRKIRNRLSLIQSSIQLGENYENHAKGLHIQSDSEIHAAICPFCKNEQHMVERSANRLTKAINWLNEELSRTPMLLKSFKEEEKDSQHLIQTVGGEIQAIDQRIRELDEQVNDLEKYKSQYEVSLKAKLKVEGVIESYLDGLRADSSSDLKALEKKIEAAIKKLGEYNVSNQIKKAERFISEEMNKIGATLDFEESYQPINLHFSLETFDLWHEEPNKDKVYLRAMGSGANWLYSHICLFLALHRYFCTLKDKCSIPSILFIDQPSQVYFPSVLDRGDKFDAQKIKSELDSETESSADEDIKSVTNLFSQLVKFCADTKNLTGIEPQIILTDHADHLEIEGERTWDELVDDRRWRSKTSGFIQLGINDEDEREPDL